MVAGSEVWELRWIAAHLPGLDKARARFASLEPAFRVVEHDVYLLTGSNRINLKIRHRENSVKLKRLVARTSDSFERWRTEFDSALPAGTELFREVLDLIGRAGPAERLGAAVSAGEAVGILDTVCDPARMVSVHKSRRQFQRGTGTLDEVRFRIDERRYSSLGVESSSLSELRTLVEDLGLGRLGSPCNYAEFLES
jgi:hypothetical protein